MDSCQYTCKPNKTITDADVKLDTYREEFIMMNTEKIIRRVRMLFKERFFYTKTNLIKEINVINKYPLVQINTALNQLINDNYEYITDKYGRIGNLINIGHLYLFQPLELTSNMISNFHRSTPIEYKPSEIIFKPSEYSIPKIKVDTKIVSHNVTTEKKKKKSSLFKKMLLQFEKAITEQPILRGEKDWFILASSVIIIMKSVGVDEKILRYFVVCHILESLFYKDILEVLQELDQNTIPDTPLLLEFKHMAHKYFESISLYAKNIRGIFIYDNINTKPILIVKNIESNAWRTGEKEDEEDLKQELGKIINNVLPEKDKLGDIVGFMGLIKNQYYIFKIKDTTRPRHKGARCDQSGKKDANAIMQKILSFIENDIDISTLHQLQICILQEFYLRLLNRNRVNNKKWYLTPTEVLFVIR